MRYLFLLVFVLEIFIPIGHAQNVLYAPKESDSIGARQQIFVRNSISGMKNNGAGLVVISNSPEEFGEAAVCGFSDGRSAAKYVSRDGVAAYMEIDDKPAMVVEDAKFSGNQVFLPSNVDLSQVKKNDYIDVFNKSYCIQSDETTSQYRWTSIIDDVDTVHNVLTVKFGGFYEVPGTKGTSVPITPKDGSLVYIGLVNKIWALNTMTVLRHPSYHIENGQPQSQVYQAVGYEATMNIFDSKADVTGIDVVNMRNFNKRGIAYSTQGPWNVGMMVRSPHIAFLSRSKPILVQDSETGKTTWVETQYVLRHDAWDEKENRNKCVGFIDKDFVYHQGEGIINLGNSIIDLETISTEDGQSMHHPSLTTLEGSISFEGENGFCIVYEDANDPDVGYYYSFGHNNIQPGQDSVIDLGSNKFQFKDLYLSGQIKHCDENGKEYLHSGTFDQRPKLTNKTNLGFTYFCTDRKTKESARNGILLFYAGDNIWVDALGRIID